MNETTRTETFSDGVFAIAATLLVLELSVNAVNGKRLGHQLVHIWPSYLAFVTSFVVIGIIWVNHHHTMSLMDHVDRTFLFINNLLLLSIAFLPFPTKLVAQYLQHDGERAAALFYTGTMVVVAVLHQVWWRYARAGRRLIADSVSDADLRAVDRSSNPGVPMYIIVFIVALFSPLAGVSLTLAIAAFYVPAAALFTER